jgi:hypothetical protein
MTTMSSAPYRRTCTFSLDRRTIHALSFYTAPFDKFPKGLSSSLIDFYTLDTTYFVGDLQWDMRTVSKQTALRYIASAEAHILI